MASNPVPPVFSAYRESVDFCMFVFPLHLNKYQLQNWDPNPNSDFSQF